jgi:hypothetical protein
MKFIRPLLLTLPLLLLPLPVKAQEAPIVSSSVGEVPLTNEQCLRRATDVFSQLGYGNFTRVGSSTDTSLYGKRGGTTAVIRCVTKFNIAVIIYSTTESDSGRGLNELADAFYQAASN